MAKKMSAEERKRRRDDGQYQRAWEMRRQRAAERAQRADLPLPPPNLNVWEPEGLKTLRKLTAMSKAERTKHPCLICGQPIGYGDWKIPTCQKCRSKHRPANYAKLSSQDQWKIDKALGLLDWDGK